MNKYQKTIYQKAIYELLCLEKNVDIRPLQELVELHTTKKPISIGLFEKTQNCPNCKSFIDEPMASYIKETHCWKCGQALDWSE